MRNITQLKGFTLIELIVVIALLAILAAVVAPNLLGKAGEAKRKSAGVQLEKIGSAVELYRLENGRYPNQLLDLVQRPEGMEKWDGPYVRKEAQLLDPWGNMLHIKVPGAHRKFDVISYGADGQVGGEGDDADLSY